MSQTTNDTALGGAFGGDDEGLVQTNPEVEASQNPTTTKLVTDENALGGSFGSEESPLIQSLSGEAQASADEAQASEVAAQQAATNAQASEDAAEAAKNAAQLSESNASASATSAATSASTATNKAAEASTSASNAATSATNASTSETNAATSATAAATSETNAANAELNASHSASSALSSANDSASSATDSSTSASESAASATQAAASASNASTSATNAATSATDAATSATDADASSISASTSASNAATSATNAANSATQAATSATNAATSATNASNSATAASTSETNAATSATESASSAEDASTSAINAATSETNASNSATAAADSASSSSSSATAAATSATSASTSATDAATSETNAASSASDAATSATAASGSATAAASSATAAATSATNASNSATASASSATDSANSATASSSSASDAAVSVTQASTSATNAATSETNAATSETNAATSATAASTSATAASTSEANAASSATNSASSAAASLASATDSANSATSAASSASSASASATSAATSANSASTSATTAINALDNFEDIYLGAKTSDPTVDNDGDPLQTGALYFNTTDGDLRIWTGTTWTNVVVDADIQAQIDTAVADLVNGAPGTLDTLNELAAALGDDPNYAATTASTLSSLQSQITTLDNHNHDDRYASLTGYNKSNWDTAYSWGDHSLEGYLTGIPAEYLTQAEGDLRYLSASAETLPDQTGHAGQFLTTNGTTADWATVDTSLGDTAYSWGNHASAGYLTTETDPTVPSHVKSITTTNISNWNTAYGWGNHASQGYATQTYVNNAVSNLVDSAPSTLDTLNELAAALGDDPNFATTVTNSIGTKWTQDNTKISNWDTAYGWGNHAGLYFSETSSTTVSDYDSISEGFYGSVQTSAGPYANHHTLISIDNPASAGRRNQLFFPDSDENFYFRNRQGDTTGWHPWRRIWSDLDFSSTNVSNWNTAYGWGNHASAGYLTSHQDISGKANTSGDTFTGDVTFNTHIKLPQNPVGTTYGNGISTIPTSMITQVVGDDDGWRLYGEAGVYNDVKMIFEIVDDIESGDTWVFRNKKTYGDYSATEPFKIQGNGNIIATGTITASGYNKSNWDTAYGWGNHANAGYLTSIPSNYLTTSTGVQQLSISTSPNYQTPSSRRVDPNASNPTNEHYAVMTYGNGGNVTGQLATHFQSGATYNRAYNNSWSAWSRMYDDDYHPNADKWTTARTLSLTGDVTGSVSWDGSANASITATVANDSHTHDNQYQRFTSQTVDLTGLDQSTYYPVGVGLPSSMPVRLGVRVGLNSGSTPSWSTHSNGFTFILEWSSNGSGWGTAPVVREVYRLQQAWTNQTICGGILQATHSSTEIVYLRGGGKYYMYADHPVSFAVYPTGFSASGQSYGTRTTVYNNVWSSTTAHKVGNLSSLDVQGTQVIDSARNAVGFVDIKGSGSYHEFGNAIGSVSNDGGWNARLNLAGSSHAKLDVKSVSDGIITSMYSHTGHAQGRIGTTSNHSLGLMVNGSVYATLSTGGIFSVFNGYQVNGTTVIDSSRNLTNIKSITATQDNVQIPYQFRKNEYSGYNGAVAKFVSTHGHHSWGISAEFRIDDNDGDRPSILFSHGANNNTWSIGYGGGSSDYFKINRDHGYHNSGWGVTMMNLDRSGNVTFTGAVMGSQFTDGNDSNWYVDPTGDTRINDLYPDRISCRHNGNQGTPRWDFRAYVVESPHHYSQSSTGAMYVGESNHVYIRSIGEASSDFRAPIFYDSNDTGYYVDPASTTAGVIKNLVIKPQSQAWSEGIRIDVPSQTTWAGIRWSYAGAASNTNNWALGTNNQANYNITFYTGDGNHVWEMDKSGNNWVTGSSRAPIFYDSNDTNYYVNPNSTSRMNRIDPNEIYNYGWFRNHESGEGMYNQATAQHFYSDNANGWNVAGGGANNWIRFRDSHNGAIRGYVYADNGNNVGFLNSGGSWRARVVGDDYFLVEGSSARAPLFYDSNNTGYYSNPASTSNFNTLNVAGGNLVNTASKSTSGWWKCAKTGVIMQWARIYVSANSTTYWTFPTAFPSACRSISANQESSNAGIGDNSQFYSISRTGATLRNGWNSSATYFTVFAIGY